MRRGHCPTRGRCGTSCVPASNQSYASPKLCQIFPCPWSSGAYYASPLHSFTLKCAGLLPTSLKEKARKKEGSKIDDFKYGCNWFQVGFTYIMIVNIGICSLLLLVHGQLASDMLVFACAWSSSCLVDGRRPIDMLFFDFERCLVTFLFTRDFCHQEIQLTKMFPVEIQFEHNLKTNL